MYTMNRKLSRKLLAMAQEYPSLVKFVRKYPDSAVEYELPKKSITVSKPRVKRVINVPETPNYGKEELEKQSFVNCMQAQALNEADVLRGDKIRRDVRNHGLPGHRRR